jgi:hypothetical protein
MRTPVVVETLCVAALTLLSTAAFANEVSGRKAEAVYEALRASGAKVEKHIEQSFIQVANLSCIMNDTSTCKMTDKISGKKVNVRDSKTTKKAANLVNALFAAGANLQSTSIGYIVEAKSVRCIGFYHAGPHVNCKIN